MLELVERISDERAQAGALPSLSRNGEPPRLNVLVIQETAANAELIELALRHLPRHEAQITSVASLRAAHFAIAADEFDVMIIDRAIDGVSCLGLLPDIASRCALVILIAEEIRTFDRWNALRNGVNACIDLRDLCPIDLQFEIDEKSETVSNA